MLLLRHALAALLDDRAHRDTLADVVIWVRETVPLARRTFTSPQ
ncbi:hypothetical protein LI90_566 [Carbonactinospora thermoautotrophica]|uniref:Uncharacterized protein n=1 Tax=Carbonactinospora thermoautotrophica TaxID=1469144 RepID=A0A132MM45_9ACTN|nr:hypothetical protein LI90_566 [Carbonactinospora thermoautotrophica]